MSTIAMSWAMAQELTTVTKMILVALADHHNAETGQCNPSVKRICHVAGTTPRTVATHIKSLTVSGHLTVTPAARTDGSQTSNDYHLTLSAGAPATSDPPATVAYHEPVTSNGNGNGKPETEPKETIETNVSTSKKRPFQITEEFRAKMAERFGGVFGDTLNERIDEALAHTSSKKYSDIQSYVTGWLRRDAERNGKRGSPSPPTPPSQPPSGWTDNGRLLSRKERQEMSDAGGG